MQECLPDCAGKILKKVLVKMAKKCSKVLKSAQKLKIMLKKH